MAALDVATLACHGRITLVTFLLFCFHQSAELVRVKKFTLKYANGNSYEMSFPHTLHGDCIYDNARDLAVCMKNHKYDSVMSKWKYKPENISYISVNCRLQRIYTHHRGKCVCKDFKMAAHPQRGTQTDSYSFCQLEFVHRAMMSKLVNLQVLDLSHNDIFRMPRNVFDDLLNLKVVILSNNPLLSFPDKLLCRTDHLTTFVARSLPITQFPGNIFACFDNFKSNVSIIDLSHSKIAEIKGEDFRHLENIKSIDLSYNDINIVHPKSFSELVLLQNLDISGNILTEMPSMVCLGLTNIKTIRVRDNNLVSLNVSNLKECDSLQHLDLSFGQITKIEDDSVSMLSLRVLNVSNNKIVELKTAIFIKALMLKHLDFSRNDIHSITDEAFTGMANLETLNLHGNILPELDNSFMASLQRVQHLRHLLVSRNRIRIIHNETFKNLSSLVDLDLSYNQLQRIEYGTFKGLGSLKVLKLRNNEISFVQRYSLSDLGRIKALDLSNNKLDTLSITFPLSLITVNLSFNQLIEFPKMGNLANIRELYLKGNALTRVTQEDFKGMVHLKELDLSENDLFSMGENCFASMLNLEVLILRDNHLRLEMSPELFEGSQNMRRLDLSHNNVTVRATLFTQNSLTGLEDLDLSFNPLGSINEALSKFNVSLALQRLNLELCNITEVDKDAFAYMTRLERVNLQNNLIRTVPLFNARLGAMFYLQGNPVLCSCGMNWLVDPWVETLFNKKLSTYDYVVDTCRIYPSLNLMPVRELQNIDFLCSERRGCPNECKCFVLETGGSVYMSVCRVNLTSVPSSLPHESEYLYLDGNNFGPLALIASRAHYTENLFLNNSGITSLTRNSFENFAHVFHLDVSYNHIKVLPSGLFRSLENLQVLNLSHNSIDHLEIGLFRNVPDLKTVDVSFNRLHRILPETLHELNSLNSFRWIHLSNNLFVCSCENHDFWHWLHNSHSRIYDRKYVTCEGLEMRRVDSEVFECHLSSSVIYLVIGVCILAVCTPLIVLVVRCRKEISAVWFTRVTSLIRNQNGDDGDAEKFDAMILYDAQDLKCSWWIQKSLLPKLSEWRKRIYIPLPDSQSRDTISSNMKACKSVIALVTHRFKDCATGTDILDEFVESHSRASAVILVSWGYFDKASIPACLKRDVVSCNFLPITTLCFWDKLFHRLSKILQTKELDMLEGETNDVLDVVDSHL